MATRQAHGVTKAEILDVGSELFRSQGPSVTVKDVANAAEVSRQTVYQHFSSRGGLITALTRQIHLESGVQKRFYKSMEIEESEKRVRSCIRVWLDYMQDVYPLACELHRARATDPDSEDAYLERADEAKSWIHDLLNSLKESDKLQRGRSVKETTEFVFSVLSPQFYELLHVDQRWSHQRIVKHLSHILVGAIFASDRTQPA